MPSNVVWKQATKHLLQAALQLAPNRLIQLEFMTISNSATIKLEKQRFTLMYSALYDGIHYGNWPGVPLNETSNIGSAGKP